MQVIESGLQAHPEEAELHFIKANMFREKGNLDQALQVLALPPSLFN